MVQQRGTEIFHETSEIIGAYLQEVCPEGFGEYWAMDHIEATLQRGPHPSADSEEAMKELHDETR